MKRRISIAAAALVAGGSAAALLLVPGGHAAGHRFTTLRGSDLFRPGRTASLAAAGRPLVVDIWAGWCGPCRREAPMLEAVARRYPGVRFAGIDVGDGHAAGLRAAHRLRLRPVQLFDPRARMASRLGVIGLPTVVLVDGDGRIAHVLVGEQTRSHLLDRIAALR